MARKPTSPMRTRSTTAGYKSCKEKDVHRTLLELDKVANGIKINEGGKDIEKWMTWKEKGLLTDDENKNSLVRICEIIGISEKTRQITIIFDAIGEENPALKKRMTLKHSSYGLKTGMNYKFDTKFEKTFMTPTKTPTKKTQETETWTKVVKKGKKDATKTGKKESTKVIYDKMDSDIEDDENTAYVKKAVAPDQEAETTSHTIDEKDKESIQQANQDVRKYFERGLKDTDDKPVGTKDPGLDDGNNANVSDSPPITEIPTVDQESIKKAGDDLVKKFIADIQDKVNEKLTATLITFETRIDTIMKNSIENYHKSDDFKRHEKKILDQIEDYVPKHFATRLGTQFNTYNDKFDQASKEAKNELSEAVKRFKVLKREYENLKVKFETSKVTQIATVTEEIEKIGDATVCEMLNQKDQCIMELNTELNDHQANLQNSTKKVEDMELNLERVEMDIENLTMSVTKAQKNYDDEERNSDDEDEIIITESDMDEDWNKTENSNVEYWKLPTDDTLYIKFINGKVEQGKPLYEQKGDGIYIRVSDINNRKSELGIKTSDKPNKLFPQAEEMMKQSGLNLDDDLKGEEVLKSKSGPTMHINTPDGQGGTTQVYTFDYYQFPTGHSRRLDTFKAEKVKLSEINSADQVTTLYMQLQHNLTQHGILLPRDPSTIERWESQDEPPTIPYTDKDFDDYAKYLHIRNHSATTIYTLLKEAIDDDWIQGYNILLTEEQRCDGYAVLYRLLELVMPKLRDIDDIHSLKEPKYTMTDTPVTFANKIAIWRQQKEFEHEHMTESNCFTYLITRIPRDVYEEGLTAIEKTYATFKKEHNHWLRHGNKKNEIPYPRVCRLSEAGAAIMNSQIAHDKKIGKTDAIVRKAKANADKTTYELDTILDQCDDVPTCIPIVHAAAARQLARTRQDVTCKGCKQWGHCIEVGGQCDFLAQFINCQHYIKNQGNDKTKLKEAVINYETRQRDRRRIIAKSSTGDNDATPRRDRGRRLERSRSPYPGRQMEQRRPRTPSAVRGLAKAANGGTTSVTFQEDEMPYGFDDSNVLFADDDSFYNEGETTDDDSHHE